VVHRVQGDSNINIDAKSFTASIMGIGHLGKTF
jgi:hypothetical protein